jgi:hypothetical protein
MSEKPGQAVTATVLPGHAHASGGTVTLLVGIHLWIYWARIATEHLREARHERLKMIALNRAEIDQGIQFGEALGRETRASMVSISAAAHALDAFYGATKNEVVSDVLKAAWRKKRPKRHRVIVETLKLGIAVGPHVKTWMEEFAWLDNVRDAALHLEERTVDSVPHPTGTSTAPENVTYSMESAERAVKLMLDILTACQRNPKQRYPYLVNYVSWMPEVLAQL